MIGRPGSPRRSAAVIRSSHASAAARSGGTVQFEFSLPRSQPQTPGWPASASAVAVASRSCASTIAGVAVPVADAGLRRRSPVAADDAEARIARRPADRPDRDPVDAAHVAGEERDEQADAGLHRRVGGIDEPSQHGRIEGVGRRLGVLPAHEDPDRVEAGGPGAREVAARARRVVDAQPVHRLRCGPVVDAEHEPLGLRPRSREQPLVGVEIRVDHAGAPEPCHGPGPDRARGRARPSRRPRATAASTSSTRKPVTPCSISSGIEPRRNAITGVPQAIASTTLNPNGSSNPIRCSSARAPPSTAERSSGPTAPMKRTRSPSIRGSTSSSK